VDIVLVYSEFRFDQKDEGRGVRRIKASVKEGKHGSLVRLVAACFWCFFLGFGGFVCGVGDLHECLATPIH